MSGYVKLHESILNSSVWSDRDLRDVFITALLMARPFEAQQPMPQIEVRSLKTTEYVVPAGSYGLVEASGQGIAYRALVPKENGLVALEKLGSPEEDSKSEAFEGRRLVRVDGGYLVLNFQTYRMHQRKVAKDPESGSGIRKIYFIQRGEGGPIKIGSSSNPWARLNELQIANAEPLTMLGTIRGGYVDERHLQESFQSHCISGEWYHPHEQILRYVSQNSTKPRKKQGAVVNRSYDVATDHASASVLSSSSGSGSSHSPQARSVYEELKRHPSLSRIATIEAAEHLVMTGATSGKPVHMVLQAVRELAEKAGMQEAIGEQWSREFLAKSAVSFVRYAKKRKEDATEAPITEVWTPPKDEPPPNTKGAKTVINATRGRRTQ